MPDRDRRPRIMRVAKAYDTTAHLKVNGVQSSLCLQETGQVDSPWHPVAEDELPSLKQCDGCEKAASRQSYGIVSMPKTATRPKAEDVAGDASFDRVLAEVGKLGDMASITWPVSAQGAARLYQTLAVNLCQTLYDDLRALPYEPVPYLNLAKVLYWLRRLGDSDVDQSQEMRRSVRVELAAALAGHEPPEYEEGMTLIEIVRKWGRPEAASVLEKRHMGM